MCSIACASQAVHAGLLGGRRLIWEEAARRIGLLLSTPAAFEGEHFLQVRALPAVMSVAVTGRGVARCSLRVPASSHAALLERRIRTLGCATQVMEWTQRVLAVGEAFAGCPDPGLRQLLERQSAKFFRLYHHSNIEVRGWRGALCSRRAEQQKHIERAAALTRGAAGSVLRPTTLLSSHLHQRVPLLQALSSMLDQELWKRLPAPLPSLAEALAARSSSSDEVGGNGSSGSGSAAAGAAAGDYAAFEAFVVRGNPWRKQQSPRRHRQPAVLPGLGTAAATSSSAPAAAVRQEVDEYGVPRAGSGSLSMPGSAGGSRPGSAQSAGSAGASRSGTEGDELIDMGQESSDAFGERALQGRAVSGRGGWHGLGWHCLMPCSSVPVICLQAGDNAGL